MIQAPLVAERDILGRQRIQLRPTASQHGGSGHSGGRRASSLRVIFIATVQQGSSASSWRSNCARPRKVVSRSPRVAATGRGTINRVGHPEPAATTLLDCNYVMI